MRFEFENSDVLAFRFQCKNGRTTRSESRLLGQVIDGILTASCDRWSGLLVADRRRHSTSPDL
jgi:hypothetical protein